MLLTSAEFCLLFKSSIRRGCAVLLTAEIVGHEFLIKYNATLLGFITQFDSKTTEYKKTHSVFKLAKTSSPPYRDHNITAIS